MHIITQLQPILGILVNTSLDVALENSRQAHSIVKISLRCWRFQEHLGSASGSARLNRPNFALQICLLLIDSLFASYRLLGTVGSQTVGLYPVYIGLLEMTQEQLELIEEHQKRIALDWVVRTEKEEVEQSFLALEQRVKSCYPLDSTHILRINASKLENGL
jgi:hypothetical protein